MTAPSAPPRPDDAADAEALRKLGYRQELLRGMGKFSNFAVSFSVISILTGAVTLYGHGLRFGGPRVMGLGWPLVATMTLLVALSLAELASAFPTAGALYHWASGLGGPGWGYATAWFNLLGQVAVTAGVDYGLAEFVVSLTGLPATRASTVGIYAAVLLSHALLNHVGVRVVAFANRLSAAYHVLGVLVLLGLLAAFAPLRPVSFLFHAATFEPHPYWYGFLIGLLQAQWTFTGYDASAHSAEETHDPSRNAPDGIVLSVALSAVVGYGLLAIVTLAIRDLPAVAAAENPFLAILQTALGPRLGSALTWMAVGAMWFCGLASITSNSRMLWAFARDGGVPASSFVARVSPIFKTPHVAIWVCAAGALAVALYAQAYAAMVALSTVALYASYGLPILAGVWARRQNRWKQLGPRNLGRYGVPAAYAALTWVAFILVLFVLPPNTLAGWTFAGATVALSVAWWLGARRRFKGPPPLPGVE